MSQTPEDFIIGQPYSVILDDCNSIRKASPNSKKSKDWDKKCLDGFKGRVRDYYFKVQKRRCAYCRCVIKTSQAPAELDHIVPKSSEPDWMYEPFNLCVSCKSCNTKKGWKKVLKGSFEGNLPQDSDSYLIVHPHIDRYSDNIRIIGGVFYEGISDKGKWTIKKLQLDRYELAADRAEERIMQGYDNYTKILLAFSEPRDRPLVNCFDAFLDRITELIEEFKQQSPDF